MLIPLILLVLVCVFYEKKYLRNLLLVAFSLSILSIILFRYGIGADYFPYKDIFYSMSKTNFTHTMQAYPTLESGFVFITLLARNLSISYHTFASILSLFMFGSYMYFQIDYLSGKELILSTAIYYSMFFLVWSLSAMRQGLAIGILLFTVFNNRLNLKLSTKLIIVLLVSTIHVSSLMVFAYLILERVFRNKKSIHLLVLSSILLFLGIFLVVPILINIEGLKNITYINKFFYYFRDLSISISAFSIRLVILLYLLFFYDWFENGAEEMFRIYRFVIIGLNFYFIFALSPIVASRLTIYSYIFIPVVLAHTIEYFNNIKPIKLNNISFKISTVAIAMLFTFDFAFLVKEARAFSSQASYHDNILARGFPTVFDKKPEKFETLFGLNELVREKANSLYNEHHVDFKETNDYEFSSQDSFVAVSTFVDNETIKGTRYGIINQNGEFVVDPIFVSKPEIYGVLYSSFTQSDSIYRQIYSSIDSEFTGIIVDYLNEKKSVQTEIELQDVVMFYGDNITQETSNSIENYMHSFGINKYEIISESIYSLPAQYSKVLLNIYETQYVVLLDESKNVVSKTIYKEIGKYNINGFIEAVTNNYTHVYNLNGDLIWVFKLS